MSHHKRHKTHKDSQEAVGIEPVVSLVRFVANLFGRIWHSRRVADSLLPSTPPRQFRLRVAARRGRGRPVYSSPDVPAGWTRPRCCSRHPRRISASPMRNRHPLFRGRCSFRRNHPQRVSCRSCAAISRNCSRIVYSYKKVVMAISSQGFRDPMPTFCSPWLHSVSTLPATPRRSDVPPTKSRNPVMAHVLTSPRAPRKAREKTKALRLKGPRALTGSAFALSG